jgi:hypothetical protein
MSGHQVYNNTVWGNYWAGIKFGGPYPAQPGGCVNNIAQNNIVTGTTHGPNFYANFGCDNPGANGSGNVYTYNAFGPEASNFIEWVARSYYSTYAAWEAATGNCGTTGCSHSMQSDPLFTNPSSGDFTLQAGSPAMGAGVYIHGVSTANPPNIGAK